VASINRISRVGRKITPAPTLTHEGGIAVAPPSAMHELRRAVVSCFLWEDQFYESGVSIAERIIGLVKGQDPSLVGNLAIEARNVFNLRHVPLLLLSAMVDHKMSPRRELVSQVIQRPDEMGELIAMLWRTGKRPIPKQVKLGIADAFERFSPYALAKYKGNNAAINLRDVLRIVHVKPSTPARAQLYKQIIDGTLAPADTWEAALSAGEDKKATFERLLSEGSLGYLALLRNLRNMEQAGVDRGLVTNAILARQNGADRVLPFRFISAVRAAPGYAVPLNEALTATMAGVEPLAGRTVVLVDVSGSMSYAKVSAKSDLTRMDAAAALGAIFPGTDVRTFTFSYDVVEVANFRGIPGIQAIIGSQSHGGTNLDRAIQHINQNVPHDRLVVITDEQFAGRVTAPICRKAYMINVAAYQNGVSYDDWIKIDGFSESVLRFIREIES